MANTYVGYRNFSFSTTGNIFLKMQTNQVIGRQISRTVRKLGCLHAIWNADTVANPRIIRMPSPAIILTLVLCTWGTIPASYKRNPFDTTSPSAVSTRATFGCPLSAGTRPSDTAIGALIFILDGKFDFHCDKTGSSTLTMLFTFVLS